jgi:hypothetical protein
MRTWSLIVCVSVALFPSLTPGPAEAADATLRERVELALSAVETLPSREDLLRLSPKVDEVLREIVEKPSRRALARSRAISALQFFPAETTRRTLRAVIQTSARARAGLPLVDLGRALQSYAVLTGHSGVEVIRPYLTHPKVDVRYAAVRALALTRSARALELLGQRRSGEPSAMVRHHIERELKRSKPESR